jgi:hypothetical protein
MFTRKLCDFKSKWTMFFPCRYSIPKAASIAIISLFLRSIVLLIQKWKTLEKTSSSNSIQQLPVQKTDRKKNMMNRDAAGTESEGATQFLGI